MTELEFAVAYNAEFNRLNPGVPVNMKWDAIQQMNYLKQMLSRQQALGGSAYKVPFVNQVSPPTPAVTPAAPNTTTNTPVSLAEVLSSARYLVTQLEALQR